MFFKKKPKPPVKKVTKKWEQWEPTIDLSNIDKKKTVEPKRRNKNRKNAGLDIFKRLSE